MLDLSVAVAQLLGGDAHAVQQRQVQVGHGGVRIDDVTAGGKLTVPAAQYDRRQIAVAVDVPVAQTAAVDDHGVIEQRSIAILNRLEPVDEVELGILCNEDSKCVDILLYP